MTKTINVELKKKTIQVESSNDSDDLSYFSKLAEDDS